MLKVLCVANGLQNCIVLNGGGLFMLGARLRKAYFSLQATAPRILGSKERYITGAQEGANFPFCKDGFKK